MTPGEQALAHAWDRGYATGTEGWGQGHKPRNPYSGEMNDDVYIYCPEHGGHADPDICEDDSHPVPPMPDCTCNLNRLGEYGYGSHHGVACGRYTEPLGMSFPIVQVARGGITYGGQK